MKKFILVLILCHSILSIAQDKFNESILQLGKDLEYYPKITSINKNYIDKSYVVDLFKKRKLYCKKLDPKITQIHFNEFISVKSTHIKSKKPLEGRIYLRVRIEEWTFISEKSAQEFEDKFKALNLECLNKGGIEFWRINEKIYLIVSQAKIFSFEFEKIKKSLNKKLN